MCQNWRSPLLTSSSRSRRGAKGRYQNQSQNEWLLSTTLYAGNLTIVWVRVGAAPAVESWKLVLSSFWSISASSTQKLSIRIWISQAALCANEGVVFRSYDTVAASVLLHVHCVSPTSIRVIFTTHCPSLLIVLLSSNACLFLRRRQKMLLDDIFVPSHTYHQIFIPSRAELTFKIHINYWH